MITLSDEDVAIIPNAVLMLQIHPSMREFAVRVLMPNVSEWSNFGYALDMNPHIYTSRDSVILTRLNSGGEVLVWAGFRSMHMNSPAWLSLEPIYAEYARRSSAKSGDNPQSGDLGSLP